MGDDAPVDPTEATEVEISAGTVRLAGVLRVPRAAQGPSPTLVLTGPFTGVKEQVVGHYASALTAAGFVTLAFDHRNFGGSSGPIRQHEDSAGKLEDLRRATSYLAARDAVDEHRLGCVGVCLGGGYALRHSAFDPRVRALATVAGGYNDPQAMRAAIGAEGYRDMMVRFAEADRRSSSPDASTTSRPSQELMWLETTNHIDLYDQPAFVDPAVERIGRWMSTHL